MILMLNKKYPHRSDGVDVFYLIRVLIYIDE